MGGEKGRLECPFKMIAEVIGASQYNPLAWKCVEAECMMWRDDPDDDFGYCGLAGKREICIKTIPDKIRRM